MASLSSQEVCSVSELDASGELTIKRPITTMLALALFLGVLVPVGAAVLVIYRTSARGTDQMAQTSEQALRERAFDQLVAISEIRKNQIERYLQGRLDLMTDVQKNLRFTGGVPEFALAFTKGLDSEAYKAAYDKRFSGLRVFRDIFGFYDVFLIDPEGNVVFTVTNEAGCGENLVSGSLKNTGLAEAFQRGKTEISLVDFEWHEPSNEPGAFLSTPLRDKTGTLLGVAAFQVSLKDINEIMGKRSGMGDTGGTYLVGEDHYLRCDSRLDHTPMTVTESFGKQIRMDSESVTKALEGKTGQGNISVQVDGQPQMILSVYTPIDVHGIRWALLAEIDEAEAFAAVVHIEQLRNSTTASLAACAISLSGVCLLAIVLVGLGIHLKIARPIRRMARAAGVAADGDLDVHVAAKGKSEVAVLGRTFDQMISNLRSVVGQADRVAQGDYSAEIQPRSDKDALGLALFEMTKTLRDVVRVCEAVSIGDYSTEVSIKGEKDMLGQALNQMITNLRSVVEQADTVARGDYSAEIQPRSDKDALGLALFEMTKTLRDVVTVCEAVSIGDYSTEVSVKGEKDMLGRALNQMITNLRSLMEQINSVGSQMASASREQAEGAKNQSVATEEMTSTVTELLASAQKMTESGASVSEQSELAAKECTAGTVSVESAVQGIKGVHERVEKIAAHMLELGSKSQQISGVLDIITELSEQTNLLSLNASIEAAGAGEAGKRFAVVASEIRKLAERATGSTGEIRNLIDGIQETVNSTIMATEEGTKAVAEGVRLTEEVDKSFGRIADQVASTTQSAKAIEMGSRQQATAIEQMEGAVKNIDTAAQQTAETAGQLDTSAQALLETARRLQGSKQELQAV